LSRLSIHIARLVFNVSISARWQKGISDLSVF
jgi:hypothetical protein